MSEALLRRLGDRLTALGFPYYFSETTATTTDGATGTVAAPTLHILSYDFRPLRDIVVFCEDAFIRALSPSDRSRLRAPRTPNDLIDMVHGYVTSLQRTFSKSKSTLKVEFRSIAQLLSRPVTIGLLSVLVDRRGTVTHPLHFQSADVAVFDALLSLLNVVTQCAIYLSVREGNEIQSAAGAAAASLVSLRKYHERFTRDNPRKQVTQLASAATFHVDPCSSSVEREGLKGAPPRPVPGTAVNGAIADGEGAAAGIVTSRIAGDINSLRRLTLALREKMTRMNRNAAPAADAASPTLADCEATLNILESLGSLVSSPAATTSAGPCTPSQPTHAKAAGTASAKPPGRPAPPTSNVEGRDITEYALRSVVGFSQ